LGEIWTRNLSTEKAAAMTNAINATMAHYAPVSILIGLAIAAGNAYRIFRVRQGTKTRLIENMVAVVL